jgi:tryptophan aminotransferase
LTINGKDLEIGLQYSATAGLPRLVKWIEALQSRVHQRSDSDGWRVTMGSGSQDSLSKAFTAIIGQPSRLLMAKFMNLRRSWR